MSRVIDVNVTLCGPDLDIEQLDESTHRLRSELLDLDIDHVTAVGAGPAPDGTRGIGSDVIGQLVVGVTPGMVALRQLLDALRGWRSNQNQTPPSIIVQIGEDRLELTNASADTERQLVNSFIERHATA